MDACGGCVFWSANRKQEITTMISLECLNNRYLKSVDILLLQRSFIGMLYGQKLTRC